MFPQVLAKLQKKLARTERPEKRQRTSLSSIPPRTQEQAKNVMLGLPNGTSEVYSGASIEKSHAKSAGHPSISHPKFSQWISSLQQRGRIPTGRRKHHRTNSSLLKGFGFCKKAATHCAERIRERWLEPLHLGSFALLV